MKRNEDYKVAKYIVTTACRMHCPYCIMRDARFYEIRDPHIRLKNAILKMKDEFPNVETIVLTGGDPLDSQYFYSILDILKTLHLKTAIQTARLHPDHNDILADEYLISIHDPVRVKDYTALTEQINRRFKVFYYFMAGALSSNDGILLKSWFMNKRFSGITIVPNARRGAVAQNKLVMRDLAAIDKYLDLGNRDKSCIEVRVNDHDCFKDRLFITPELKFTTDISGRFQ